MTASPVLISFANDAAAQDGGFLGGIFGAGNTKPASSARSRHAGLSPGRGNKARSSRRAGNGRYRTLCVRTCDGYYWPVSFSTSRAGFARDAEHCASSCAAPAKLFVYRNPGAEVAQMVDLQGRPYARLENAYRYRKEYIKQCACRPEPWSKAAKQDYARRMAETENPGLAGSAAKEKIRSPGAVSAPVNPPAQRPQFPGRKRTKKARWRAAQK